MDSWPDKICLKILQMAVMLADSAQPGLIARACCTRFRSLATQLSFPLLRAKTVKQAVTVARSFSGARKFKLSAIAKDDLRSLAKHVPGIVELDLSGMAWLRGDLAVLESFPLLSTLNLSETGVSDVTQISSIPHLTELDLSRSSVRDLGPLVKLSRTITKLNLAAVQAQSYDPLRELTAVRELRLACATIESISPVSGMGDLLELDLYKCSVSDISALSQLTNLTHLYLWSTAVTSVAPLSALPGLVTLVLTHTPVSSIAELGELHGRLQTLDVMGTLVETIDVVLTMTSLTDLNIRDCRAVVDLSMLAALPRLSKLDAHYTSVADIAPLAGYARPDCSGRRVRPLGSTVARRKACMHESRSRR
jgi:Leucine-rich repeat (LRR) protein